MVIPKKSKTYIANIINQAGFVKCFFHRIKIILPPSMGHVEGHEEGMG